jgi:hypothetical protein
MQDNLFMAQIGQLLNIELRQICMAAQLAMLAPNEPVRKKLLHFISGELQEAMSYQNILCVYSDQCMPVSPGTPCPSMGPGMGMGPGGTCPDMGMGPGIPGIPCPGVGVGPLPGVPCPGVGPIPGILPPAGPAATLPPSVPISPPINAPGLFPGIYPGVPYVEKEKKEEEK